MSEQKPQRGPRIFAATSDSDGRFTIKSVPAGRYQFFASHTGYVNQQYQSSGAEKGAVLALRSGQEIKDVLFRMILAAVATGRVTDEDGKAMENIQIVPCTAQATMTWKTILAAAKRIKFRRLDTN
jgi:hypothetical protein